MSSKAVYGPQHWPAGRPRDARSPLLTGTQLRAFVKSTDYNPWGSWQVEPWLQHHGVPVDVGTRVLAWLGHSRERGTLNVQYVVKQYRGAYTMFDEVRGHWSYNKPLDESDHAARDILIKAILEAKKGMPESGSHVLMNTWKWAPAGVVEQQKWWSGGSAYYSGRAPMARMLELPDDALRCICEQLVPLVPPERKVGEHVLQSDEDFIAESRAYCEEESNDASLHLQDEEQLDELIHSLERMLSGPRMRAPYEGEGPWRRGRGCVGILARVSKRWQPCLKRYLDVMRAEIERLEAHRAFLVDTRHKVYNFRVSQFGEPYRSDY